jgi:hypothetical protein
MNLNELLTPDARTRHVHIIGQTGTGKSALMANLIADDLRKGNGVGLIDPHGELAQQVLGLIPARRFHELRYVCADDRPIGINPLWGVPFERRAAVADQVLSAFRAVWGWTPETAPRALPLLRNAIRTALDLPAPTFIDVLQIVTGEGRQNATDPMNRWYWAQLEAQDKRVQQETVGPVLTRLDALLTPPVRAILCQRPKLDLRATMDEGRILVCNLDKRMGELNSHLLGAFIVSGIVQAAMDRSSTVPPTPFYLFVDEFANYADDSFATALSETRKKGLSLTIAHQFIRQVEQKSEGLMDAVFGNTGTTICFRVGAKDADLLASHLGGTLADIDLNPRTLKELPNYHCIARVLQGGAPIAIRIKTEAPPSPVHDRVDALVRNSRTRFGRDRALVEQAISSRLAPPRLRLRRRRKW